MEAESTEEIGIWRPEIRTRQCLGHDCYRTFEGHYPGLCPRCKRTLGMNWKSPIDVYSTPGRAGRTRNIRTKDGE